MCLAIDSRSSIEKPAAGGRMIARHDGAIVLVSARSPAKQSKPWSRRCSAAPSGRGRRRSSSRRPIASTARQTGRAAGCVFAHIALRAPAGAQARHHPRCLHAHRPHGAAGPLSVQGIGHATAIGCGRGCTCSAAGSASFARARTSSAIRASTRQLLPATVDALARSGGHDSARCRAPGSTEIEVSENCPANQRCRPSRLASWRRSARLGSMRLIAGVTGMSCGPSGRHRSLRRSSGSPEVERHRDRRRRRTDVRDDAGRGMADRSSRATGSCWRISSAPSWTPCPAGRVLDFYAGVGCLRRRWRRAAAAKSWPSRATGVVR